LLARVAFLTPCLPGLCLDSLQIGLCRINVSQFFESNQDRSEIRVKETVRCSSALCGSLCEFQSRIGTGIPSDSRCDDILRDICTQPMSPRFIFPYSAFLKCDPLSAQMFQAVLSRYKRWCPYFPLRNLRANSSMRSRRRKTILDSGYSSRVYP
jgi:hypothetical protein